MNEHDEKIPNPRQIEKEISEFLAKKFGDSVKVVSPIVLPHEAHVENAEVPPTKKQKINFDLKPEDLVSYLDQYMVKQDDAKAIPLPATMVHDLSALLSKQDTTVNLYSSYPFPNRKDRQLDAFQQKAWDYLSNNPQGSLSQNETRDGKNIVRVAVADTMVTQA